MLLLKISNDSFLSSDLNAMPIETQKIQKKRMKRSLIQHKLIIIIIKMEQLLDFWFVTRKLRNGGESPLGKAELWFCIKSFSV